MPCNSTKQFWVGDFTQLFCAFNIFPQSDNLVDNMNALTRLVIVISLIVLYLNLKVALLILFVGLSLVTIFYYSLEKVDSRSPRESFEGEPQFFSGELTGGPQQPSPRFCNDATPITPNDPGYLSKNQILTQGGSRLQQANPKTYVKPLIAAPSHDLSSWKANDFVHHSGTNHKGNFDLARAGYSLDSYGPLNTKSFSKSSPVKSQILTATGVPQGSPQGSDQGYQDRLLTQTIQPGVYQKDLTCEPINSLIGITAPPQLHSNEVQKLPNGGLKLTELPYIGEVNIRPSLGTPVDKLSLVPGSQPGSQLQPPFDADQSPFNKPPGTFPDLTQSYDNVYDPRLTGYGDQSRFYIDPMTGSPSWYYKDVESITKPNYITRSKVDTLPFADTYGPDKPNPYADSANFRELVNQHFHDSQIAFRTDLQTRLMRKRNSEMAQLRAAPISTQARYMAGFKAYA